MKKYAKLIPTSLVALCALASCGESNNAEKNELEKFVDTLAVGDLTEENVAPLFKNSLLATGDKSVTYSEYTSDEYSPYSAYVEGLDESQYEEYVKAQTVTETYRKYDNEVVLATIDYTNYPYDASLKDDTTQDGISKTATKYKGQTLIYRETSEDKTSDTINYIYTQDSDPANAYSFFASAEYDEEKMNTFLTGGGLGETVIADVAAVDEWYESYSSSITEDELNEGYSLNEIFSAKKETVEDTVAAGAKDVTSSHDVLSVKSINRIDFPVYSLEASWGCEYDETDTKHENPKKLTTKYDGLYMGISMVFGYSLTIEYGLVTSGTFIVHSYFGTIYEDANWKKGDATPSYNLTADDIAKLDLTIAASLRDGSENPWDFQMIGSFPYAYETVKSSNESLGNYRKTKPDTSKYREADATDLGSWFSVQDLLE